MKAATRSEPVETFRAAPPRAVTALLMAIAASVATVAGASLSTPAHALSEIQREDLPKAEPPSEGTGENEGGETVQPAEEAPAAEETPPHSEEPPDMTVPFPDPIRPPTVLPEEEDPEEASDPNAPLPEVIYDLQRLPEPVRRLHRIIVEACKAGDLEALRPYLATGEDGTQLSLGATVEDPIAYLKEMSGDGEGYEVLAIIQEVLEAGFIHADVGTDAELYVWPYFFGIPLDRLTGTQQVELFRLVTAGDYEDMKAYGTYNFYRLGITPEGRWAFFIAGD